VQAEVNSGRECQPHPPEGLFIYFYFSPPPRSTMGTPPPKPTLVVVCGVNLDPPAPPSLGLTRFTPPLPYDKDVMFPPSRDRRAAAPQPPPPDKASAGAAPEHRLRPSRSERESMIDRNREIKPEAPPARPRQDSAASLTATASRASPHGTRTRPPRARRSELAHLPLVISGPPRSCRAAPPQQSCTDRPPPPERAPAP